MLEPVPIFTSPTIDALGATKTSRAILGYSEIGNNCIIGAGTVITQYKKIPNNSLVFGNPAKIMRALREDEIVALRASAMHYYECAKEYVVHLGMTAWTDD